MDTSNPSAPASMAPEDPAGPERGGGWRKALVAVGAGLLLLLKLGSKAKLVLVAGAKFFPLLLKTGGTMLLSIGLYALAWGWKFAAGFVLLLLVHECGHLLAARRVGLKVGLPVFIPFMGAFIALKEAPRNAWIEAQVGIGGPLLGSLGALACDGLYWATGNPLYRALAFSGLFLNLFNLAPIGMLDGGRIVTALSPWLWIVGLVVMGYLLITHFNILVFLILLLSLPRIWFLFRPKTEEELRYFEVAPWQRAVMGALYFGLIALLVAGMQATHIRPPARTPVPATQVRVIPQPDRPASSNPNLPVMRGDGDPA
ncbi:MAG TPA: site-2 protease family protein [Verrucomicrobiota bacterium]|nr:site-2 protease family protein [Verrucomicrobiota bacterium]HNU49533.1 site-2 protease family protein [Verrucomicrobiota bacterium]